MGSLIERRKRILMATDPDIPPWYQRIEYIRCTSTAAIVAQYTPVIGDEITVDYMADDVQSAAYKCLFSAGAGTYQLIALGTLYEGKQSYYSKYFASGSSKVLFSNVDAGIWVRMTVSSSGLFEANGASVVSPPESAIDGTNNRLFIFRRANSQNPFIGKLKSFTIKNNGIMKLNLIPCIRLQDNVAGAYDTVSKVFYGSSGSEAWIPSTLDT